MEQSNPGMLISLRLFLEGIEIPVISASVTATVGSPASASIEVIPDSSAELLLPRTVVHLFYLDYMEFKRSGRSSPILSFDYKLLFCGELFTLSENKMGAGSRSITLSCLDFSNILDTSFAYTFRPPSAEGGEGNLFSNKSNFLATPDMTFDTIIQSPSELIRSLASSSPISPSTGQARSVLGGLLSILEYLLGVQGNFYGVNGWTTIHERRTRLIESIVSDSGETAAKIFNATQFSGWLKGRLGQEGDVISFRRIVDIIFSFIFYSWVPNPCAKYVPGNSNIQKTFPNRDVPEVLYVPGEGSTDPNLFSQFDPKQGLKLSQLQKEFVDLILPAMEGIDRELRANKLRSKRSARIEITNAYREADSEVGALNSKHKKGLAIDFRFKYTDNGYPSNFGNLNGTKYYGMPFKNCTSFQAQEDPGNQDTWYFLLRKALFLLAKKGEPTAVLATVKAQILKYPDIYASVFNSSAEVLNAVLSVAGDWESYGEIMRRHIPGSLTFLPSFGSKKDPVLQILLTGIGNDPVHVEMKGPVSELAALGDLQDVGVPTEVQASTDRERLNSFVLRPDVWFVAPPKSNVIFPDVLQSFSMQRDMLRETSRLQLDIAADMAEGTEATTRPVFAPLFQNRDSLSEGALGSANSLMIYDHEKYAGVVPKFDRMIETMFYIEKDSVSSESLQKYGELGEYPFKVAHFNLLNERYGARTATASLAFSPQMICGFPAVVIDAVITDVEINSADFSLKGRSFKLGMVQSVSHAISQSGAQTQVQLTHVRSHRTGDGTDDLFSELISRDGTLTLQDPLAAQSLAAGGPIFVTGSKKVRGETPDLEFGWRGLAGLYGFSSIEELIEASVEASTSLPWTSAQIGVPVSTDLMDSSENPSQVTFSEVLHVGIPVSQGVWVGGATLVWVVVTTGPDSPLSTIEFTTTAPVGFQAMVASLSELRLMDIRKFVVVTPSNNRVEVIPLYLPGNRFEAVFSEDSIASGKKLPIEESIRPIWISDAYNNTSITAQIYDPFFGTSSITDGIPAKKFLLPSIEEAVDRISIEYSSAVRSEGISPLEWAHKYTERDIARYFEVLSPKEIKIQDGGPKYEERPPGGFLLDKYKYYGGFHSNAVNFGDSSYGSGLEFLDIKNSNLKHRNTSTPDPFTLTGAEGDRLDPRADRAKRVLRYKSKISGSAALGVLKTDGIGKRG
jgi:hypothetical protein